MHGLRTKAKLLCASKSKGYKSVAFVCRTEFGCTAKLCKQIVDLQPKGPETSESDALGLLSKL